MASKTKISKYAMLIYNKNISVSPVTTHLPINNIAKNLSKKSIIDKAILINKFFNLVIKKNLELV